MQEPNSSFYSQSNAIPGPSYQQPLPPKAVPPEESQDGDNTKSSTKTTKKKAAKACLQCQRAHLTCNDSRPCQRCVKKGLGKECAEGLRKKAKYLMDDSEKLTIKRTSSGKTLSSSNSPRIGDISELPRPNAHPLPGASRLSNSFGATPTYEGESSTGRKSQTEDVTGSEPSNAMHFYPTDTSADVGNGALMQPLDRDIWQETDTMYDNLPFDPAYHPPLFTMDSNWPESTMIIPPGQASTAEQERMMSYPFEAQSAVTTPGMTLRQGDGGDLTSLSFTGSAGGAPVESPLTAMTPSDVYSLVVKPHDYTEGYHDLMKHLAKNFNQAAILRVVRALAAFRPSLIALQMPLTFEDEVFLEKTFQRTLIVGNTIDHSREQ
ncbi:hypothetical protein QFC24_001687 [Naganishia onofrii]|uniref:Uncharacterized protein n=1 Tax=Naganishia onofrii TaxID=1851511 RepID=A0ACC2XTU0_9TREE|nr:hypothetical protein QFC24_001687 [Naganishia onofrii]